MRGPFRNLVIISLTIALFSACKKEKQSEPDKPVPDITNIEVGLNNNEIGVIGKDFHFNAEVLAATKLENIQIKILQRQGENYTKTWQHEITWEYKDAKNATVHKHFNIPDNAPEGKYDFLIVINDQSGSKLEIKKSITIYMAANVPVNPAASIFNIFANDARFYRNGKFTVEGSKLKTGDVIKSQVTITDVKDDGKMYVLLINKKLNHRPESIEKIDFSKVIVYDVLEHKGWVKSEYFSNSTVDPVTFQPIRVFPSFTIGGTTDNNTPIGNAINGVKAWESGTYYFGVVYKNTTHNIGFYHYIEVSIEVN
ncbi:DUF4625 domain-containing protein [Mucilaginibacter roseus]|uniref:DUF4625 domain-containing protein n=1 Tax=Mucilaginibacter roseus TaxID=1528868 RepID=A0ABS8U0B4_9SPHI|nr:DUF4625 domain-containing protein [Mucilaginibacter roseus]MCD8739292.1 DUF4625 domain-containing protein [Mucilaginibacter roseus]